MEETLQHKETTQCIGLPPTGSAIHHPDGPKAHHALTFNMDQSKGADQFEKKKIQTSAVFIYLAR